MGALALYAQRCRIYCFRRSGVGKLSRFSLFAGSEFREKVNRQKALAKPYQKWFETVSLELMTTSRPFCMNLARDCRLASLKAQTYGCSRFKRSEVWELSL